MFPRSVKRTPALLFGVMLALVLVTGCGTKDESPAPEQKQAVEPAPAPPKVLSIGTSPVGASWNSVGNGLASVLSKHSDLQVSVKPMAGVAAWGPQFDTGEVQLGVASGPESYWAHTGTEGFTAIKSMRLLVRGHYIPATGPAVRKDSKITSVAQLKGKRVSSDYPGSAIAKNVVQASLYANGLTWDDVKKVPVTSTTSGFEAIRDNRLDACFALSGTTPVALEVHNALPLTPLPFLDGFGVGDLAKVPQETVDKITESIPSARMAEVKKLGWIEKESLGIEYTGILVGTAKLDDDTVYKIMETLWTNYEELWPVHNWLKSWKPDMFFDPNPVIAYHPGAVKFFKDNGLWNDEMEQKQLKLLKLAN